MKRALGALIGLSLAGAAFFFLFVIEPVVMLSASPAQAAASQPPGAPGLLPPPVTGPGQPGAPMAPECPHPPVTQGYGPVTWAVEPPAHGFAHFHGGIDLACPHGTQVSNVGYPGIARVTLSGVGYGNHVDVEIRAPAGHFFVRYAHLAAVAVKDGEAVQIGTRLGWEGSTGASTGPHLHFGVYLNGRSENDTVDPRSWLVL